jgi:hypothetical protein
MYHDNAEPCKLLMCYEDTIASAGGDEATLAKFLITSLEDAAANLYSRVTPPKTHLFLEAIKRQVSPQLLGVPG